MNRSSARTIALALLCLVALVVAAATLTSMQAGGGGDGGLSGGGSGADPSGLPAVETNQSGGGGGSFSTLCVEPILSPGVGAVIGAAALGAAYLTSRRYGLGITLILAAALLPLLILFALMLTGGCAGSSPGVPAGGEINSTSGGSGGLLGGGGGDGDVPATAVPSLALLSVLLLAIGGAVAALFYADTGERESRRDPDEAPEDDEERRSELGRAAGRAADRIEGADDVENEVYRAWREMADALPIERPASSTPGEFAAAARGVGVDADDVDELTELFEAVRYGGREATGEREERAVAALRRIESSHGGDDDG